MGSQPHVAPLGKGPFPAARVTRPRSRRPRTDLAGRVITSGQDSLWYKDAVIYEVHVRAFQDSNADGVGDFRGLEDKLDYLRDLGITAIWLLPFYPSPLKDDGYDIADYYSINPLFGTLSDFKAFLRQAHARGLRVITELVVNHTSDQHPWFQRSRRAPPGDPFREFYVWSDSPEKYRDTRIIFRDFESSNWSWDHVAQGYYWHRFYSHQPDLNYDNPHVQKAITKVLDFWLDLGVDGLRLDAVPYLYEREGTSCENLPETHAYLKTLRQHVDQKYGDRMLLGEANQWPEDAVSYFGSGKGDECHMAFHFPVMPRIFMALRMEDRVPIVDILDQTPRIPETSQWALFLRNHDELTLEMVTDEERDYMYRVYARDARARINLGIRRRLAPLMSNNRRRIELMKALLLSLPGTPVLYYGDEIGMGDNIYLGDRNGVRTPMQWSPDRNAGFSKADPERLYLPPVMDSVYGYEAINVEAQLRQSSSLLNWTRRLMTVRKAHKALGRGTLTFLYPRNRKVLAYLRCDGTQTVLCVANMSRAPQSAELDLAACKGRVPVELLGRSAFPPIGDLPYFVTMPGYCFYGFLLAEEAEAPNWYEPYVTPLPEFRTLVLGRGWGSVIEAGNGAVLWQSILPGFLPNQRWFGGKGQRILSVSLVDAAEYGLAGSDFLIACIDAALEDGTVQRYLLPLTIAWETKTFDPLAQLQPYTLARVRLAARVGALHDAMASPPFAQALVRGIRRGLKIPTRNGGRVVFRPSKALAEMPAIDEPPVERLGGEQSNTSVLIGTDMILK